MYTKTGIPELLALFYFGWMVALSGCDSESIQLACHQSFQRIEEANACVAGAMIAQERRDLAEAEKMCDECYLQASSCEYVDGGVRQTDEESRADFANRRTDLYTACYKGAEGYLELN